MKQLKHPATVIAAMALFIAIGGGAVAYAAGVIDGSQIKNHSIAAKKLTPGAIKALHGQRGPKGAQGVQGVQGVQGPQGPGGTILTYDANAVIGSPAPTTIGSVLGDTYGATCTSSSGSANLSVYLKTTDGSWNVDYDYITASSGTISQGAHKINVPAGSYSTFQYFDGRAAASGNHEADGQLNFLQISPSPGELVWHETAITTVAPSATCHLSIQGIPENVTAVHGARRAGTTMTSPVPIRLTH